MILNHGLALAISNSVASRAAEENKMIDSEQIPPEVHKKVHHYVVKKQLSEHDKFQDSNSARSDDLDVLMTETFEESPAPGEEQAP